MSYFSCTFGVYMTFALNSFIKQATFIRNSAALFLKLLAEKATVHKLPSSGNQIVQGDKIIQSTEKKIFVKCVSSFQIKIQVAPQLCALIHQHWIW